MKIRIEMKNKTRVPAEWHINVTLPFNMAARDCKAIRREAMKELDKKCPDDKKYVQRFIKLDW